MRHLWGDRPAGVVITLLDRRLEGAHGADEL
jgi:hypothetical protein